MLGAGLGVEVELFEAIRRDARREGLGIRELASRHRVHRRTVRQALTEREETASVAIASNESFSGWTKTFSDPQLCAAIGGPFDVRGQHH